MNYTHLYLHDDNAQDIDTPNVLSIKNDENAAYKIRGKTIGQVTLKSNNWIHPDTEDALTAALATISMKIREDFLSLPEWEPWRKEDVEMFRVRMASGTIYLYFVRPESVKKIPFTQQDIATTWVDHVNGCQDIYRIRSGSVSSGSPEGGVIQFAYELKK